MEAATKNKRGRPELLPAAYYAAFPEMERRATQNKYYAHVCIHYIATETPATANNFFVTPKGNTRRQGIAEQLGRIYAEGIASLEECRELLETIKQEYAAGASVKDLERKLRRTRQALTKERET